MAVSEVVIWVGAWVLGAAAATSALVAFLNWGTRGERRRRL